MAGISLQVPRSLTKSPPKVLDSLFREGIRPDLELHDLAACAEAALHMPDRVLAVVGVERAALPSTFRVVDTPVEASGEKSQWIGHTEHDPLAVGPKRQKRIRRRPGRNRNVRAQAERVEAIDEIVVLEVWRLDPRARRSSGILRHRRS